MSVRKFSTASILSPAYKNSKIWDGETFPGYFESIATVVVPSAGQALITFNNIPQNYTHLQVRCFARSNRVNTLDVAGIQIGSAYPDKVHSLNGDGSSASGSTSIGLSLIAGNSATSGVFGAAIFDILDYTNTNKNRVVRALSGFDNNGSGNAFMASALFLITNPLTTFSIYPANGTAFTQNSHFALYGIRGA